MKKVNLFTWIIQNQFCIDQHHNQVTMYRNIHIINTGWVAGAWTTLAADCGEALRRLRIYWFGARAEFRPEYGLEKSHLEICPNRAPIGPWLNMGNFVVPLTTNLTDQCLFCASKVENFQRTLPHSTGNSRFLNLINQSINQLNATAKNRGSQNRRLLQPLLDLPNHDPEDVACSQEIEEYNKICDCVADYVAEKRKSAD